MLRSQGFRVLGPKLQQLVRKKTENAIEESGLYLSILKRFQLPYFVHLGMAYSIGGPSRHLTAMYITWGSWVVSIVGKTLDLNPPPAP